MSGLKKELLRKLIHLFEFPIIAGYVFLHFYFSPKIGLLALTGYFLILLEIEYLRIDYRTKIGDFLADSFLKLILRKHERNNLTGAIFFVISAIISFSVFDFEIALLALLFAVFGDLAASLMGIAYGKRKIFRNKSYIGSFSCLIVNIAIGILLMPNKAMLFLPMAIIATMVETLTQKLDDNLTVPLFAGFTGQLIVYFL